jgi:hypothetical protein
MQSVLPKAGRFRRIFHSPVFSTFTSRLAQRIGFLDLAGQAAEHDQLSLTGSLLGRPELFPSQMQRLVTDFFFFLTEDITMCYECINKENKGTSSTTNFIYI